MTMNFGPADVAKISEVAAGLSMPELPGLSAATLEGVRQFNADAAGLRGDVKELAQAPQRAIEATQSEDFGAAFAAIDVARINRAEICQKLTRLWRTKRELAERCIAELKALLPPAEAKYAEVVETVKSQLVEIGSGPESYPGHNRNVGAAEHQFDWDARNKNAHSLAAAAVVADVGARIGSATEHHKSAVRGAETAKRFIENAITRMVEA